MKRKSILAVAGLVFLAFGLGLWVGSTRAHKPIADTSYHPPGARPSPEVGNAAPCVDIRNAGPLVGESGCVSGLVLRVYSARTGNTFLDFCQDFRTCPFTSVIFASDKSKFGNLEALQGKRVEIRGEVIDYQGRAEIIIRDPQQVRAAP